MAQIGSSHTATSIAAPFRDMDLPAELWAQVLRHILQAYGPIALGAAHFAMCLRAARVNHSAFAAIAIIRATTTSVRLWRASDCCVRDLRFFYPRVTTAAVFFLRASDHSLNEDNVAADEEMARRLPFALSAFPLLEHVELTGWELPGGRVGGRGWHGEDSTEQVWRVACKLMDGICSSIEAGSFAHLEYVDHGTHICPVTEHSLPPDLATDACRWHCRRLVDNMPVRQLFQYIWSHGLCVGELEIASTIVRRGGTGAINAAFPVDGYIVSMPDWDFANWPVCSNFEDVVIWAGLCGNGADVVDLLAEHGGIVTADLWRVVDPDDLDALRKHCIKDGAGLLRDAADHMATTTGISVAGQSYFREIELWVQNALANGGVPIGSFPARADVVAD